MTIWRAGSGSLVVWVAIAASAVIGLAGSGATMPVDPVANPVTTVALDVGAGDAAVGAASIGMAGMRPGDTSAAVLRVTNTGTVPLSYHVESIAASDDGLGLGAALVVKVTGARAAVDAGRSSRCPGEALRDTGDRFGVHLVGSSAASGRRLAAGASETLCIQARLPVSAPSSLQGAVTRVDLEVHGMP